MHKPTTAEGQHELMELAATTHANAVLSHIRNLNCSSRQKLELINAVVKSAKNPTMLRMRGAKAIFCPFARFADMIQISGEILKKPFHI